MSKLKGSTIMSTKVITGLETRLSYANIWEAVSVDGGEPKYSVSVMIPKSDKETLSAIKKAMQDALEEGKDKFGGEIPNPEKLKLPLRDGDEKKDERYQGYYYLNASSKNAPQIVDRNVNPILDRNEVYSGCYARVSLNFYAFNTKGSKGIAVSLGNIQKVKDGESFSSRSTPADDFTVLD